MSDEAGFSVLKPLFASALLFAFSTACHADTSTIEDQAKAKLTKVFELGGEAQDFLKKAKAADQIADPLARCLAFPDFPGNEWPAGLAKAHCELVFGRRIGGVQIRQAVNQGKLVELDRLFTADLARHFSETDFSEVIHGDFDAFDGKEESEALSKLWLEKAPKSPYALTARGDNFMRLADAARAGLTYEKISQANRVAMSTFADQAIGYYQRALKLEPRLLPAYIGLIRVGRLDSRTDVERDAMKQGRATDRGCAELNRQFMSSLAPRWGGSYEQMQALADELQADIDKRPLLALSTVMPRYDAADVLWVDGERAEASAILGPAVLASTLPDAFEVMGVVTHKDPNRKPFESVAYAVAATRYRAGSAEMARFRGSMLHQDVKDPEWALASLQQAVRDEPADGKNHYFLGDAYLALGRTVDAQQEFNLAMADEATRTIAMRALSRVLTVQGEANNDAGKWVVPADAIRLAAAAAPVGVPGVFVLTIQAMGSQNGALFLNSEDNYRDPRNLTIAIVPDAASKLIELLGADPQSALKGKRILVTGVARRVTINVTAPGRPDGFYYQTHVEVTDPAQIKVIE